MMNVLRRPAALAAAAAVALGGATAAVLPYGAQAVLDNERSYNVVRVNDIFKDLEGGTVSIRPNNQHDDVTLWAAPGFHWETSNKGSLWDEGRPPTRSWCGARGASRTMIRWEAFRDSGSPQPNPA